MVALEPEPEAPAPVAPPSRWRAFDHGFAALAGALLAAFVLLAAARQRATVPYGAWSSLVLWSCGALVVLPASWVRRLPAHAAGRALGLGVGLAVGLAGLAGCLGARGLAAAVPLLAAALGLGFGASMARALPWSLLAVFPGALAMAAVGPRLPVDWASEGTFAGLCVLVLAFGVALARSAPAGATGWPAREDAGRWGLLARWTALAASAWLAGGAVAAGAFATVPGALALAFATAAAAACVRPWPWLALAGAGLAAGASAFAGSPGSAAGARVVAGNGAAAVVYVRATQELRLCVGGEVVDAAGPDRCEAALAATLAHAWTRAGDRVLVLGAGTGRVGDNLQRVGERDVDVVDWRAEAAPLRTLLSGDGPVVPPGGTPRALPRVRWGGPADALAGLADGARQAIVLAEPLALASPATQVDVQAELARVAGGGPVLQVVALDRVPAFALHDLFAAAHAVHRWNGLFVVGDAAVLVSTGRRVDDLAAMGPWSPAARWLAHEAHLGDANDLRLALLGTLVRPAGAATPAGDAVGRAAALDVVRAWLRPAPPGDASAASVLSRWTAQQAELRAATARLRALADDDAGREQAQAIAARFLHVGAPRPELQAALGLACDGIALRAPALASRCAFALDPTFFVDPPAVCASLPRPAADTGPLEDLAALPPAARLCEIASGTDPFAVALRARFPSRCACAFVMALREGPLPPEASQALRELADPFVLREVAAVVVPAGRTRELLGLWRFDLPMPPELGGLVRGTADDRRILASALRARRDPSSHGALADLLEAPEPAVRQLAAEALRDAVGDRVAYDPDGTAAARHEAAERLRSLPRTP